MFMGEIKLSAGWMNLMLALICILASIAGTWALFGWRLNTLEARVKASESLLADHNEILVRNEEKLDNILSVVTEIKDNMDCYVLEDVCLARRDNVFMNN